MSELVKILRRIKQGEMSFEPANQTQHALDEFQIIGKAIAHADKEGLLEKCLISKNSTGKDLFYDSAHVIGGLTFKGEEFLKRKTTVNGWLNHNLSSIITWLFGIFAGLILAMLAKWLIP